MAGLAAAGVAWWQGREADVQRRLVQRAEKAEAEAQRNLFDGMVPQARYARLSGAVDARFLALDLLEKAAALRPEDAAVREEFVAALATPGLRRISAHPIGAGGAEFDPDLTMCFGVDAGYGFLLMRLTDGKMTGKWPRPADTEWTWPVHVNAEGLCAARDNKGRLHLMQDEKTLRVLEAEGTGDCHWSVSRDSTRAVAWRTDGTVTVVPLSGSAERNSWKCIQGFRHGSDLGAVLYEGGRRAAFCQGGGDTVLLHALEDGRQLHLLKSPRALSGTLAVTPDGSVVVCGMMDGGLAVWRPSGTGACEIIEAGSSYISSLALTEDGRFLATLTWAAVSKLWDLADGTCVGRLDTQASAWRFSREGHSLAILNRDGVCLRYQFEPGVCQGLVLPRTQMYSPASLSGQTFTYSMHPHAPYLLYRNNSALHLADAAALRPVRQWPLNASFEHFSDDGRWLYLGGHTVARVPLTGKDGAWSAGLPQLLHAGSEDHSFTRISSTTGGSFSAALCTGQSYHLFQDDKETGKIQRPAAGTDFPRASPFRLVSRRHRPQRPGAHAAGAWRRNDPLMAGIR